MELTHDMQLQKYDCYESVCRYATSFELSALPQATFDAAFWSCGAGILFFLHDILLKCV